MVLQGGWGILGKRSSGEILLRLTYKAYVEDEEDDKNDSIDIDASDDELSDSEESSGNNEKGERDAMSERESFMDVLAALIVSEEFQGIVASETGYAKPLDDSLSTGSNVPRSNLNLEPNTSNSDSSGSSTGTIFTGFLLNVICLS